MKSNLDAMFKTNEELETGGIDLDFGNGLKFKVKRFGGMNSPAVKKEVAKRLKPFATIIKRNMLAESKEREIYVNVFVESSMVGWCGVEIDGKKAEYSKENAVKLFMSLPELFNTVMEHAQDADNFLEELGNS